MEYDHEGSSASLSDVPKTLRNFGYSNGGVFGSYDTDIISRELKNGYPILISGKEFYRDSITPSGEHYPIYESGHTWIGQGLYEIVRDVYHFVGEREYTKYVGTTTESEYYVLCNMGWGMRKDNGYYLSAVFDTRDGAVYPENYSISKGKQEGDEYYFKYYLHTVTGIRK